MPNWHFWNKKHKVKKNSVSSPWNLQKLYYLIRAFCLNVIKSFFGKVDCRSQWNMLYWAFKDVFDLKLTVILGWKVKICLQNNWKVRGSSKMWIAVLSCLLLAIMENTYSKFNSKLCSPLQATNIQRISLSFSFKLLFYSLNLVNSIRRRVWFCY